MNKIYYFFVPKEFTNMYYTLLDEKYPRGTYSDEFRYKQLSRMLDMFVIHWFQYWLFRLVSKRVICDDR